MRLILILLLIAGSCSVSFWLFRVESGADAMAETLTQIKTMVEQATVTLPDFETSWTGVNGDSEIVRTYCKSTDGDGECEARHQAKVAARKVSNPPPS